MKTTLEQQSLYRFGLRAIEIIVERTLKGIDAKGNPFRPYSTRPLAIPAGAVTKRAIAKLKKDGSLSFFTTKKGSTWIIVAGGYRELKDAIFARAGGAGGVVNLSLTGAMLRSLAVIQTDEGASRVTIGFLRAEESQKAFWNSLKGRDFLGLTEEDLKDPELVATLIGGIAFTR